jgi:hypothetical protein
MLSPIPERSNKGKCRSSEDVGNGFIFWMTAI